MFKALRRLNHSTLGSRVTKKKREGQRASGGLGPPPPSAQRVRTNCSSSRWFSMKRTLLEFYFSPALFRYIHLRLKRGAL